jgi:hypothetical protein
MRKEAQVAPRLVRWLAALPLAAFLPESFSPIAQVIR